MVLGQGLQLGPGNKFFHFCFCLVVILLSFNNVVVVVVVLFYF